MLTIHCPWCGLRDHSEFTYGGDASVARPSADAGEAAFFRYVYERTNPKGVHREYWHHVVGCREWLCVTRDTANHEIGSVVPAMAAKGDEA